MAVIGDGAVGQCAITAAKRLGAARIVAMSRYESRQKLAAEFGATDVVAERGTAGVEELKQMFGGVGPDAVLECRHEGVDGHRDTGRHPYPAVIEKEIRDGWEPSRPRA